MPSLEKYKYPFKFLAHFFFYNFIYLLTMLGLCCCAGFSPVVAKGPLSSLSAQASHAVASRTSCVAA